MTDSSGPAVIETVNVALRSYYLSPTRDPHITTHDEIHEAIRGLKVSKVSGPIGLPNRALKHLPKRKVSLLASSSTRFSATVTFPKRGMTLK